jgi:hypothetical protein
MLSILTDRQQEQVLDDVTSRIEEFLSDPKNIWGPQYVVVIVKIGEWTELRRAFGTKKDWNPEWGDPERFWKVAEAKLAPSLRAGLPSSEVPVRAPFLLEEGDCLWPGAVSAPGIAVAASGARAFCDEGIAKYVLDAFQGKALEEVRRRIAVNTDESMIL